MIQYNKVLTTTERQQVESYLVQKWGLSGFLSVGHPGLTTTVFRTDYLKNSTIIRNTARPIPYFTTFSPRQIPGLGLWMDAADSSTITQTSGNISQWADKSTSALTATAVNSPTVVANVQNGLPGISFNGSSQYFNLGNNLNMGTNQLYIFVVSKFNSTADGAIIGKSLYGGATGRYSLLRVGGILNPLIQGTGGGNDSGVNSDTNTSTRLLNMVWDRSTIILYQNGTSVFSVGLSEAANVTNGFSLLIGAYQNGSGGVPPVGLYLNGFIHEILIYFTPTSSPLTSTQRQQIESYLAQKWGLTASLPGGHSHFTQRAGAITTVANTKFRMVGLTRAIVATGGTVTTSGGFRIHSFTSVGTTNFVLTSPSSITAQVLVVAGGGAGGLDDGGGGGAGGVIYNAAFTITSGTYGVVVGNGGTSSGASGENSVLSSLTAVGGGGGANSNGNGGTGGSGGGIGWGIGNGATPGSGTAGQGFAGGSGTTAPNYAVGGGGGAGGVGGTGSGITPGNGGIGVSHTIAGTTYNVGGGGGGGLAVQNSNGTNSTASFGGGNGAGRGSSAPVAGTPNTGGGGGGGNNMQASNGAFGGSGIVIIAYSI
jgi:hypothetical protein